MSADSFCLIPPRSKQSSDASNDNQRPKKTMNLRMSAEDKRRAKIFEQAMRFAWEHDTPYHQTPVFYAWKYMMAKCYNPKHPEYPNEGARGIDVYEPWHRFSNFLADVGHPPESGEGKWGG